MLPDPFQILRNGLNLADFRDAVAVNLAGHRCRRRATGLYRGTNKTTPLVISVGGAHGLSAWADTFQAQIVRSAEIIALRIATIKHWFVVAGGTLEPSNPREAEASV